MIIQPIAFSINPDIYCHQPCAISAKLTTLLPDLIAELIAVTHETPIQNTVNQDKFSCHKLNSALLANVSPDMKVVNFLGKEPRIYDVRNTNNLFIPKIEIYRNTITSPCPYFSYSLAYSQSWKIEILNFCKLFYFRHSIVLQSCVIIATFSVSILLLNHIQRINAAEWLWILLPCHRGNQQSHKSRNSVLAVKDSLLILFDLILGYHNPLFNVWNTGKFVYQKYW